MRSARPLVNFRNNPLVGEGGELRALASNEPGEGFLFGLPLRMTPHPVPRFARNHPLPQGERGRNRAGNDLKLPQQTLDVIELELRALRGGEAPAQLLENARRALDVDLAGNFHAQIVAEIVAAHRPAERIGVLLRARRAVATGLSGTAPGPLLHLLGHTLGALAQGFERAALGVDRAVGILLAERALGVAHGLFRAAERIVHALALLPLLALLTLLALLAELAAPVQLLQELPELAAQRLLVLLQIPELVVLLLLALLALLSALAALLALAAARLLALPEGAVAQLLLLVDHVAELVERRHVVVLRAAGLRHLQVLEHRLQFLQQLPRRILGARTRQILDPVEQVLQVLRAEHARVGVERTRELLRIVLELLGERLQELVERRAQLLGQLLDLLVVVAALERLAQRYLRCAQRLLACP